MEPLDPRRFRPVPRFTGPEVSRRAGIPHEYAKRLWLALGLPDVPDDEVEFDDRDLEVLGSLKLILDQGYSEEEILEVGRAYGQALSRVAQAEVRVFNKAFITPLKESTASDEEIAQKLSDVIPVLLDMLGGLLDHIHRRHLALALQHVTSYNAYGPSEELAAGFVDLVDFSRVTQELEGEDLGELVSRYESLAVEQCVEGGAHVVKMIGDAVMFVSPDASVALTVALRVVAAVEADEALPAARAGLDYGPAVALGGDFFGRPVNVAARLTSFARPATVVVSAGLKDALPAEPDVSSIGKVRLHNVGQIRAYKVNGYPSAS